MQISMKKTIVKNHLHQNFGAALSNHFSVKKLTVFGFYNIVEFHCEDTLHHKHFVRAVNSEHFRELEPTPLRRAEIFDEFFVVRFLKKKVEFHVHCLEKLFRNRLEIYSFWIWTLVDIVRQRENERHIVTNRLGDAWFPNFYNNFFASFFQSCGVNLRNWSRSYRIFVKFRKNIPYFSAELTFNYRFYLSKINRFHIIRELFELFRHRSGDNITPERHHLP